MWYNEAVYDKSTGFYYLSARYYDPEDGRFLTRDSYRGNLSNPSTLHLYAYCANNPVNYEDPSGHIAISRIVKNLVKGAVKSRPGAIAAKKKKVKTWRKAVAKPIKYVKKKLPSKKQSLLKKIPIRQGSSSKKVKTGIKKVISKSKLAISSGKAAVPASAPNVPMCRRKKEQFP